MKISNQIVSKLIKPLINKDIKNWRIVLDAIEHWLTESQLEMLLEMIHNDGYKVHQLGDIVKFKPESWDFKDLMMPDIMKDWELMDSRGYMYGKIVGDTSFDDRYNPFYYKLKLKVYLHGNIEDNWNDPSFRREIKVIDHDVDNISLHATKLPTAWRDTINNLA
tara:strand:- start:452 stop:943 length:492 start_codon:yes stop_codon:yes gene_type:complete